MTNASWTERGGALRPSERGKRKKVVRNEKEKNGASRHGGDNQKRREGLTALVEPEKNRKKNEWGGRSEKAVFSTQASDGRK